MDLAWTRGGSGPPVLPQKTQVPIPWPHRLKQTLWFLRYKKLVGSSHWNWQYGRQDSSPDPLDSCQGEDPHNHQYSHLPQRNKTCWLGSEQISGIFLTISSFPIQLFACFSNPTHAHKGDITEWSGIHQVFDWLTFPRVFKKKKKKQLSFFCVFSKMRRLGSEREIMKN